MKKQTLPIALAVLLCSALLMVTTATAAKDDDEIKVKRVEIMLETATVRVNQTRTLYGVVYPRDADDHTLIWESSNPEIVGVDGDGAITGISPGTAQITATSHNGKVGTCTVTVPATAIQSETYRTDVDSADRGDTQLTGGEVLYAAVLRSDVEQAVKENTAAALTYTGKTTVSTTALRAAAYAADTAGGTATIRFHTVNGSGGVLAQLTIKAGDAPDADYHIRVDADTTGSAIAAIKEEAAAYFGTPVTAVRLSQAGAFGLPVSVAVKLDTALADAASLSLYQWKDSAAVLLDNQSYSIDGNGYIHFTLTHGGDIVIAAA